MIDLRSDTLTQPTDAMREAMAAAPVGDDVFGEDPTVNRLEERVAVLLCKEAALFVPSGTMGNQIGVRVHCQPGDEFLADSECHIYHYEQAAYAQLFGVAVQPIAGEGGVLSPEQVAAAARGDDLHHPRTRLLCLENTHNRRGGRVADQAKILAACEAAQERGLACHLDGARLWNAAVATGLSPADLAKPFDTMSVCFSKGLGAPVGSAVVGSAEAIARARRHRKAMGGGMRQAGVLAAAALFALENHVDRLADDHRHAQLLADAVRKAPPLDLVDNRCDTNIVLFTVDPAFASAAEVARRLRDNGVLVFDIGKQKVRAVTHLGVAASEAEQASATIAAVAGSP